MRLPRQPPRPRLAAHGALAAGAAVLALAALGCGTAEATEAELGAPARAWQLTTGTGPQGDIETPASHRITLLLGGERVSGVAACNSYGGAVQIAGDRLQVGDLVQTEMACEPPVMAAESAYLEALRRVETLRQEDHRLVLAGPSVELNFEPLPPVPARELLDTQWELDTVIVGETAASALEPPATLQLDGADATLRGGTGCRAFTGNYSVDGDHITIMKLEVDDAATAGVCPESAIEQERLVLDVLGDRFRTEVEGDRLTLAARDGRALVYRAR